MLLTVDVGNTHTVFGLYDGDAMTHRLRTATMTDYTADQWELMLGAWARERGFSPSAVRDAILCSVVPGVTRRLGTALRSLTEKKPIILTADLVPELKIAYDKPREVGADRLANAVAARRLYRTPAIVVDLGTATTFDVISARGVYKGGVILPGVETSFAGLASRAALLPRVDLEFPSRVIGTTTRTSMQAGIMYGTVDQIKGIIRRIDAEQKVKSTVILTGGLAPMFAAAFPKTVKTDVDLTLKGLKLIHMKIR